MRWLVKEISKIIHHPGICQTSWSIHGIVQNSCGLYGTHETVDGLNALTTELQQFRAFGNQSITFASTVSVIRASVIWFRVIRNFANARYWNNMQPEWQWRQLRYDRIAIFLSNIKALCIQFHKNQTVQVHRPCKMNSTTFKRLNGLLKLIIWSKPIRRHHLKAMQAQWIQRHQLNRPDAQRRRTKSVRQTHSTRSCRSKITKKAKKMKWPVSESSSIQY